MYSVVTGSVAVVSSAWIPPRPVPSNSAQQMDSAAAPANRMMSHVEGEPIPENANNISPKAPTPATAAHAAVAGVKRRVYWPRKGRPNWPRDRAFGGATIGVIGSASEGGQTGHHAARVAPLGRVRFPDGGFRKVSPSISMT